MWIDVDFGSIRKPESDLGRNLSGAEFSMGGFSRASVWRNGGRDGCFHLRIHCARGLKICDSEQYDPPQFTHRGHVLSIWKVLLQLLERYSKRLDEVFRSMERHKTPLDVLMRTRLKAIAYRTRVGLACRFHPFHRNGRREMERIFRRMERRTPMALEGDITAAVHSE